LYVLKSDSSGNNETVWEKKKASGYVNWQTVHLSLSSDTVNYQVNCEVKLYLTLIYLGEFEM